MATLASPPAPPSFDVRRIPRAVLIALALLAIFVAWLMVKAPPWRLRTLAGDTGVVLLDAGGMPFARRGDEVAPPIAVAELPPDVRNAFIAIEDRRFYSHGAVDPRGLARAMWHNARAGSVVEGGSTITQQYVKNAFLQNDRTIARKAQEMLLAGWVELWLSKDEILARYLARAYFGDQCFGLEAAARHYFDKPANRLTLGEAALLAGLVKAPSRLAPTRNIAAAGARMRTVLGAMADAGFIDPATAADTPVPALRIGRQDGFRPGAPWFADWVFANLPADAHGRIATTLDPDLQARAERAVMQAPLGGLEVALVAMRPDGRVVAMIGGRDHGRSTFNRATQAMRQTGSTFKLFDYLTAFRNGAKADDPVDDTPLTIGNWSPANADQHYRGRITLREAFAISSNTAAVRVAQAYGFRNVAATARDLGVTSPIPDGPSMALGTGTMHLIELASAYAAVAGGKYPVVAHGDARQVLGLSRSLDDNRERAPMLELLWQATNEGTGRQAALSEPTFGKTGTSQDGRDALYVGFAGDLVTAIWVGRDDNGSVAGAAGGKLPAMIWRAFMTGASLRPIPGIHIRQIDGSDAAAIADPVAAPEPFARSAMSPIPPLLQAQPVGDWRDAEQMPRAFRAGRGRGHGHGKHHHRHR